MTRSLFDRINQGEEGHAVPLLGTLIAGAGGIVLAIGAAQDSGVAAVIGGIVLAVGLVAESVLNHVTIDWEVFRRLDQK